MYLLDAREPMRFVPVCQASTAEPPMIKFDLVHICALIDVYTVCEYKPKLNLLIIWSDCDSSEDFD